MRLLPVLLAALVAFPAFADGRGLVSLQTGDDQRGWEAVGRLELGSRTPVVFEGSSISVTTSIGIAAVPDHATGVESLIRCADRALYRAKSAGRDRAVVYDAA